MAVTLALLQVLITRSLKSPYGDTACPASSPSSCSHESEDLISVLQSYGPQLLISCKQDHKHPPLAALNSDLEKALLHWEHSLHGVHICICQRITAREALSKIPFYRLKPSSYSAYTYHFIFLLSLEER